MPQVSQKDPAATSESPRSALECIDDGFPLLQSADVCQKLLQWNLDHSLRIERFRVFRKLSLEDDNELMGEFFRDPTVRQRLRLASSSDLSKTALHIQPLRVTATSLSFFDKLVDARLVAESGALRRCMDDVFDGATASDLVKESFVNPDTENDGVFTEQDQQEFIFQIFRAFVVGGSMCQSDESIAPYESMTKRFYKALVSVKKDAADPATIDITSRVYSVQGASLFESHSRFSSCFVVLDSKKRWLTVWHNTFRPFW